MDERSPPKHPEAIQPIIRCVSHSLNTPYGTEFDQITEYTQRRSRSNMLPIKEIQCSSAAEFVALLRRSHSEWLEDTDIECKWIFRGVGDEAFLLLPTLWRQALETFPFYDCAETLATAAARAAIRSDKSVSGPRIRDVYIARGIESYCLQNFALAADELGLRLPDLTFPPVLDHRDNPIVRRVDSINPFPLTLALARHHGMPSQLLDWTLDPLIAGYFAATASNRGEKIAVWALNERGLSEKRLGLFKAPRSDIGYLHRQEGVFTYAVEGEAFYIQNGRWPSIADLVSLPYLRKVTLPVSEVNSVCRLLLAERISKASLMPTFDNVAEFARSISDLGRDSGAGVLRQFTLDKLLSENQDVQPHPTT